MNLDMSKNALENVKSEFGSKLQAMLDNRTEYLGGLREFYDAIDWYRKTDEGKKDPGKVNAMVVNLVIEKLLDVVPLRFLRLTFDKILLEGRGKADVAFG